MSTIGKQLSGILFSGPILTLASAPWRNNVRVMYGFNPAGTAYTSFKPTSNFNSLKQLVQDGAYIVDTATPDFELPGAVLTAGILAPTLTISDVSFITLPDRPYMDLKCRVTSSNSADTTAEVFASYGGTATFTRIALGQVVALRFDELQNYAGISSGENINLLAISPSGAIGRATTSLT